jgi:four helix bundle protein
MKFSEEIIVFCSSIRETTITRPLISQLVRSGTSIGANYCEANNASSKKDFQNKIFICKKESQETKYWLGLLSKVDDNIKEKSLELSNECHEFVLIFQKIVFTMKNGK